MRSMLRACATGLMMLLLPVCVLAGPGDRAYLGVNIEEEIDHPEGGARVTQVVEGSPAAEAGLRVGDIVIRFGDDVIRGPVALTTRIHEHQPGDRVPVTVLRDGRKERLEVELGERDGALLWFAPEARVGKLGLIAPQIDDATREKLKLQLEELGRIELPSPDAAPLFERWTVSPGCEGDDCAFFNFRWRGRPLLGVELVETTPELRRHLGGGDDAGVLIGKVLSGMPAEAAGIRVGDLLVRVAGEPVGSTADLRHALSERAGETFQVEVLREGRPETLTVTLPADDDEPTGPRASARVPRVRFLQDSI